MVSKILYLETSVFGFYFDKLEVNKSKRIATQNLFQEIKEGLFEAKISRVTLIEILRLKDESLRHNLLSLPDEFGIEPIELPEDKEPELWKIANELLHRGVVPVAKRDDAFHIAFVTLMPEIDVLVSWNCKHIANINVIRKIKSLLFDLGYTMKFEVATPEEVILYE